MAYRIEDGGKVLVINDEISLEGESDLPNVWSGILTTFGPWVLALSVKRLADDCWHAALWYENRKFVDSGGESMVTMLDSHEGKCPEKAIQLLSMSLIIIRKTIEDAAGVMKLLERITEQSINVVGINFNLEEESHDGGHKRWWRFDSERSDGGGMTVNLCEIVGQDRWIPLITYNGEQQQGPEYGSAELAVTAVASFIGHVMEASRQ